MKLAPEARPLIGLSGRRWPAEWIPLFDYTALHGEEVDVHLSEYPKVIERAGGLPVQLTRGHLEVGQLQLAKHGGEDVGIQHQARHRLVPYAVAEHLAALQRDLGVVVAA